MSTAKIHSPFSSEDIMESRHLPYVIVNYDTRLDEWSETNLSSLAEQSKLEEHHCRCNIGFSIHVVCPMHVLRYFTSLLFHNHKRVSWVGLSISMEQQSAPWPKYTSVRDINNLETVTSPEIFLNKGAFSCNLRQFKHGILTFGTGNCWGDRGEKSDFRHHKITTSTYDISKCKNRISFKFAGGLEITFLATYSLKKQIKSDF